MDRTGYGAARARGRAARRPRKAGRRAQSPAWPCHRQATRLAGPWRRPATPCLLPSSSYYPSGRLGVELGEEPVDHAGLPCLVGQRLTDDLAGQFDRERANLSAQRGQRLLPVRVDLGRGGRDQALTLGDAFCPALRDNLRGLFPCLLAHPGRLVPGLGELRLVLIQYALSLFLGVVG